MLCCKYSLNDIESLKAELNEGNNKDGKAQAVSRARRFTASRQKLTLFPILILAASEEKTCAERKQHVAVCEAWREFQVSVLSA